MAAQMHRSERRAPTCHGPRSAPSILLSFPTHSLSCLLLPHTGVPAAVLWVNGRGSAGRAKRRAALASAGRAAPPAHFALGCFACAPVAMPGQVRSATVEQNTAATASDGAPGLLAVLELALAADATAQVGLQDAILFAARPAIRHTCACTTRRDAVAGGAVGGRAQDGRFRDDQHHGGRAHAGGTWWGARRGARRGIGDR